LNTTVLQHILVYADDNLFKLYANTIKNHSEFLLQTSKETSLEENNTDKTKYMNIT